MALLTGALSYTKRYMTGVPILCPTLSRQSFEDPHSFATYDVTLSPR